MIYIDPPYNTGSDGFVYADDRKFTNEQLQQLAGIDKEQAQRILEFTNSKSNSHSAWLTFMYPRLYIAKQLLREDGVIFVSIDDNEVAQLRLLMDEVFGEENTETMIWNKEADNSSGTLKQTKRYRKVHEYICVSYKNKELITFNKINEALKGKENDFQTANLAVNSEAEKEVHNNRFDLQSPNGKIFNKQWKFSKDKIEELIKSNLIYWGKDGNKQPRLIIPMDDRRTIYLLSILNYGGTTQGNKDFAKLFNNITFSFPKTVVLLKKIIETSTNHNDLILDFFAGSGTTADAVIQLNAEDGGNRHYILVQLDEKIDSKKSKTAYNFVKDELHEADPSIFHITKERILRAANKIQEDNQEAKEPKDLSNQDFGFKIFATTPLWEDYHQEQDELEQQQKLNIKELSNEELQTLLITWKTHDSIALTQNLTEYPLGDYISYLAKEKLYLVHKNFTTENLKLLLEKIDTDRRFNPQTIILYGYHFDSKALREIEENIKSYSNKKGSDITCITRY